MPFAGGQAADCAAFWGNPQHCKILRRLCWTAAPKATIHRPSGAKARDILDAQIAQLVEQRIENPRVAGSIPALGTISFFIVKSPKS